MPRLPLELEFVDNNGHRATTGLHIPPPSTVQEFESASAAWAGAFAPLSTAGILRATYTVPVDSIVTTSPQAGSNVYTRLVLLFRVDGQRGIISIPSPAALPFDVAGPYRNIRLARQALDMSGLLGPLESAVLGLCNPDGDPFPGHFVVAGKAR